MGNRRFALVNSSDEEDEAPHKQQSLNSEENLHRHRTKKIKLSDEEEEEEEMLDNNEKNNVEKEETEALGKDDVEDEEEPLLEDVKPVGESIKSSSKGKGWMNHYKWFEFDGTRYDLDITQNIKDGGVMVT